MLAKPIGLGRSKNKGIAHTPKISNVRNISKYLSGDNAMCRMGFLVQLEIESIFGNVRRGFRDFKTLPLLEILSKVSFSTTPQNRPLPSHKTLKNL